MIARSVQVPPVLFPFSGAGSEPGHSPCLASTFASRGIGDWVGQVERAVELMVQFQPKVGLGSGTTSVRSTE